MSNPDRTRRDFLAAAAATTAGLALAPSALARLAPPPKKLDLLILGGTGFLGPHVIKAALDRGHSVTMFNRGQTEPRFYEEMLAGVENLHGDRREDLSALGGDRRWDAVIDTSAYYPRVVDMSAGLLKDRVGQYVLVSTMSVYGERNDIDMDETAAVGTIDDPTTERVTGESYGPLKALCEAKAEELMPGCTTVVRPGLIVGFGDNTNRYTYWPARAYRAARLGERMACPGDGTDYLQYIDVRDLADWMILALEQKHVGVYNAVTPARARTTRSTFGAAIAEAEARAGAEARHTWVPTEIVLENNIQPWQQMTCWIPPTLEGYAGIGQASVKKIVAAGMTFRGERDTAASTLDWWLGLPQVERDEYWDRLATAESAGPGEGRRPVYGCPRDLELAALADADAQQG